MSRRGMVSGFPRARAALRAVFIALFVVTLASAIVLVGDARTCPTGGKLSAFAIVATPTSGSGAENDPETRVRAGELSDLVTTLSERLDDGSLPAAPSRTENVRAGRFLQTEARVTSSGGRPAAGVKVVFTWLQGDAISYDTVLSDGSGHAKTLHWIAETQRGQRTVLVVTASRTNEYASAYTWFIPE